MTRNTILTWSLLFILAVIDIVWLSREGMSLAPNAIVLMALFVVGFMALAGFYIKIRPNPRIATMAHTAAAMLAFMCATCVLSYLAVTLRRPLVDPSLIAIDRALGLDWLAMFQWVNARPWLHKTMQYIYIAQVPEIYILLIVFSLRGQILRAWELLWISVLTCLGCVFFSGLWPAVGAFATFHVQLNTPYLAEFAAVRDGTLKIIDSTGNGMQGLVTFPSLHMALVVIAPYAARGVPVLFPVFLVLNILIALTTPAIGGHYFADLWGGTVLALASIWIVRKVFANKPFAPAKMPAARKARRAR